MIDAGLFFPFSLLFSFFSPPRGRFENKLRKTKHGQMLGCEPSFENVLCLEMKYYYTFPSSSFFLFPTFKIEKNKSYLLPEKIYIEGNVGETESAEEEDHEKGSMECGSKMAERNLISQNNSRRTHSNFGTCRREPDWQSTRF